MIIDKILNFVGGENKTIETALKYEVEKIAGYVFQRQFFENKERQGGTLWMSSAGKCPRQQAYAYHNIPKKGKEIDNRAKIIFFMGDLTELMIVQLAKAAGCVVSATGLNQISVSVKIGETLVKGHPDGILYADDETYLIEVKSMSDYGFKKFERGEIDDSYIGQVNIYMDALHLDKCVFIGLNKNNGILHEVIIRKNPALVSQIKKTLGEVLGSTPEKLPPPAYPDVDAKGFYSWRCRYCSHYGVCKPNAELVLVGKSYKLREGKPKEKTITDEQQRNLELGRKRCGIKADVLREYLSINYTGQNGKSIKKLQDILENDYKTICQWIVDVSTTQRDIKQERRSE